MTITSEPQQSVSTPSVRRAFRASRFWIGAAVVVVLAIIGYNIATPPAIDGAPLASDGTGETGAGALVSVLRQHGVSVSATSSLTATAGAVSSRASTTIFIYDPSAYLDASQRARLTALAAHVVVLSPTATALHEFAPGLTAGGPGRATLTADCAATAALRAGTIADGGHTYIAGTAADVTHSCFPSAANRFAMIQLASGERGGDVTIVGATKAFTNEFIGDRGNAALAINLLGSTSRLVWYLPSIEDVGASGRTVTLANAAPHWLTPLLLLALLVAIAAGVWRGRRFGPLVLERLPVIVRASETMEGRARLYQASSARLRALDALRVGTIQRVAVLCGLSRRAALDEVIGAVAGVTGRDPRSVRDLLVDTQPSNDASLVQLSDALLVLEQDVAGATRSA